MNVIELSSYQLEVTPSLTSDIAIIMNITPDHLDRHGGMQGYIRAKEQVRLAKTDGLAILGEGDALDALSDKYIGDKSTGDKNLTRLSKAAIAAEARHIASFNNLALSGLHNAQNCLAARTVCKDAGASGYRNRFWIPALPDSPHRLQPAGQINNILYVNDSKATNGDASCTCAGQL